MQCWLLAHQFDRGQRQIGQIQRRQPVVPLPGRMAKQWPLLGTSDSTTIIYLTQARLHNPCKRSKNAYGGVGSACQGGVLDALPPGDVFVIWSIFGDDPEPATGEHEMIGGHKAIVSYRDNFVRGMAPGTQVGIAVAISTGTGNWYEMEACLRGPGLREQESEVRAMLQSVRFQTADGPVEQRPHFGQVGGSVS
jgi:hypothetical protein